MPLKYWHLDWFKEFVSFKKKLKNGLNLPNLT